MNREKITKIAAIFALAGIIISIISAGLLYYIESRNIGHNLEIINEEKLKKDLKRDLEKYSQNINSTGVLENTSESIKIGEKINSGTIEENTSFTGVIIGTGKTN